MVTFVMAASGPDSAYVVFAARIQCKPVPALQTRVHDGSQKKYMSSHISNSSISSSGIQREKERERGKGMGEGDRKRGERMEKKGKKRR